MKERPILFSGPMVKAILEGEKTQTRRVMRVQPWKLPEAVDRVAGWMWTKNGTGDGDGVEWGINAPMDEVRAEIAKHCPQGQPGDLLWVREAHTFGETDGETWADVYYRDETHQRRTCSMEAAETVAQWVEDREVDGDGGDNWRPSIHMPRWASRITLEVVNVRVQRLQEITHEDARCEGFDSIDGFALLWDRINEKRGYGWHANPWVWAVEFRAVQP